MAGDAALGQPTADALLGRLEPLVGHWTFEAAFPDGRPWPGGGTMTIERHASGAHLLVTGTAELPEAPATVSVIGCDGATGRYVQLYSDERGVSRVYEMSFDGAEWRMWREGEPFDQRFVGRLADDGDTIEARWERRDGDAFVLDFTLTYRRAAS